MFFSWLDYSSRDNTKSKVGAVFAIKKNALPFLEMIIIPLLVYFALLAKASSISLMQCVLVYTVLMIATCFFVRAFHLREKSTEKITSYSRKEIDE
ncbi:hypothetical protein [Wolbachia pipientis]|uniref:hypothetical protein n=1 Tax=Wolbachia pipientis TaxID=955 RepID=UPI0025A324CF|nr:hypothetical protein [Wolbachia pipientis]MDM8335055.1 hypothetical protein [Wolbachia pipientis]